MKLGPRESGGLFIWSGLTHQHGANAETHQEESATAVQQVHLALQLESIRINNGNGDDGNESVERVKCRKLELVFVHQSDTNGNLHEDGDLRKTREPPQRTRTKWSDLVCCKCPDSGETISDDDNPRPRGVEVKK